MSTPVPGLEDAPCGRAGQPDRPAVPSPARGADPIADAPPGARSVSAPRPPRYLISDLCADLEAYLPPEQVSEVYRAYLFGAEAHAGQQRQTGEPYIYHPIAVARILAEMRMDHKCLMAAILHDVLEDTGNPKEELARGSTTRSPSWSTASAS
jgi:hypothetical protein